MSLGQVIINMDKEKLRGNIEQKAPEEREDNQTSNQKPDRNIVPDDIKVMLYEITHSGYYIPC